MIKLTNNGGTASMAGQPVTLVVSLPGGGSLNYKSGTAFSIPAGASSASASGTMFTITVPLPLPYQTTKINFLVTSNCDALDLVGDVPFDLPSFTLDVTYPAGYSPAMERLVSPKFNVNAPQLTLTGNSTGSFRPKLTYETADGVYYLSNGGYGSIDTVTFYRCSDEDQDNFVSDESYKKFWTLFKHYSSTEAWVFNSFSSYKKEEFQFVVNIINDDNMK